MSIRRFLTAIRERWIVVITACAIGAFLGLAIGLLRPANYTATLDLYVSAQTGDNPQEAYQGAQLSEQRVTSYTTLVNSPQVTRQVVEQLQLPETPEQLGKTIFATSTVDSVVIRLSVVNHDPVLAAAIANRTASAFADLVTRLEQPTAANQPTPVAIRVVDPAQVPSAASSVGAPLLSLLGAGLGLLVGIGLAVALNLMDNRVRTISRLQELSGLPTLGAIANASTLTSENALIGSAERASETFRSLRTNLTFVNVDSPPKTILVTSALPAEGKSTTLANLAVSLADAGNRVLAIDADLRRPSLSHIFSVRGEVGLSNILAGRISPWEAIQHYSRPQVDIIATGPLPPNPSELLGSKQASDLIRQFRSAYDIVLIDTPPLLPVTDAAALASSVDGVLFCCRSDKTTTTQVRHGLEALSAVGANVVGTVLTMVASRNSSYGGDSYGYSYGQRQGAPSELDQPSSIDMDASTETALPRPSPHRR